MTLTTIPSIYIHAICDLTIQDLHPTIIHYFTLKSGAKETFNLLL